jgi:signal transduction histidine kinase
VFVRVKALLSRPEQVRRLPYGLAAFIVFIVLATVDSSGWAGWAWPALPVGFGALALPARFRASIWAACAGFVALASNPNSVQLGLAVAAFVFVSTGEDAATRPWRGWVGGCVGASVAFAISLVSGSGPYLQPYVFVGAGYLLAMLLRAWSRGRSLTHEARELRGQAVWLEQRTNLARELHDAVGHHVTAMVVQAEAGQLGEDPRAALQAIASSGRTALGELDALVVHLRDPAATVTVTAPPRLSDIDELLAEPLRQQGVAVAVRLDPEAGLDEVGILTAYRIAQEALTNVARHARASAAWVELARLGDRVRLRVSDDGVGTQSTSGHGSGLLGISERVRACGGSWELSERPGGGTMLEADLPVAR